jgi:hypothetical protein
MLKYFQTWNRRLWLVTVFTFLAGFILGYLEENYGYTPNRFVVFIFYTIFIGTLILSLLEGGYSKVEGKLEWNNPLLQSFDKFVGYSMIFGGCLLVLMFICGSCGILTSFGQ